MTIIKAVRAIIELGGINLEVFMLPDGTYRLSQTQVLESAGVPSNWISRLQSSTPKQLKALRDKGFRGYSQDLKVLDESKARKIKGIPIDEATKIWGLLARGGNSLAMDLLEACASEAIERRADAAYEVQRTEAEIEERLKARVQGKVARRSLTDAIKSYLERHNYPQATHSKIYATATDAINVAALGKCARALVAERKCNSSKLRDTHTAKETQLIDYMETHAAKLIDKLDITPQDAVNQAIAFYED